LTDEPEPRTFAVPVILDKGERKAPDCSPDRVLFCYGRIIE
jgi:hypothetical protein